MPTIAAFTPSNQNDIVKQPQWVTEGNVLTNPELFAVTPASAAFQDELNAVMDWSHEPTLEEVHKAGDTGRVGQTVTEQIYNGVLVTKIVDDVTLKWAMNKENAAGTVAESRTWAQSYYIDQTETYEIATGCLPTKASLRLNNKSQLVLTVEMRAADVDENQTADGGLTTPTWEASGLTGDPIQSEDGGAGQFTIGSTAYPEGGMLLEVTHDLSFLNPSESLTITHARSGKRSISGSFDIQGRPDTAIRSAQKAGTAQTLTRVISTSPSITATVTGMVMSNYKKPSLDPTSGAILVESIPFTADDLAIA